MGVRTVLRYLIGDRASILQLAADRRSLVIGLLFVLSAGFAREYDGEYLLMEPWHLVLPLAASLLSSFVLFNVGYAGYFHEGVRRPNYFGAYLSFLGLFWLTAPLAWLYAVPYERFLGPVEAIRANLWTLGLVSVWRVALMVRVFVVLFGYARRPALFLVMAVADTLAVFVLSVIGVPVVDAMGGVRTTEWERETFGATRLLHTLAVYSWPVWAIGAGKMLEKVRPVWQLASEAGTPTTPPSRGLWRVVIASLAVWFLFLPFTQPEQRLRYLAERSLRQGRIVEGLDFLSRYDRDDFPPHWEPPPSLRRSPFGPDSPQLLAVIEVMTEHSTAAWVRQTYLDKLREYLRGDVLKWTEYDAIARLLELLPEGPLILEELQRDGHNYTYHELRRSLNNPDPPPGPADTNEAPP